MSNILPRTLPIDRSAIRGLKSTADVVQWLESYVRALDGQYAKLRNTINNFGMGTANWDVREATDDDVTASKAQAAGNLIVTHKTNGTRHEFEA